MEILPVLDNPVIISVDDVIMKWAIIRVSDYSRIVEYEDLNDLAELASDIIFDNKYDYDTANALTIEIEDGTIFPWSESMARYCFYRDRLSVDDFVKYVFLNENPGEFKEN